MNELIATLLMYILSLQSLLVTIWIIISGACIGLFIYTYALVMRHRK
jgi:hypothetical protein